MRAINTTTATRPSPTNWHLGVALALAAGALALPATATAYTDTGNSSVNSITGASTSSENSGSSDDGSAYSSVNATVPPVSSEASSDGSGYSSVNAIAPPAPEPTLVSSPPSSADDGFEWLSAAIGAAAAMALLALGVAALLTVRRRTTVSAAR